MAVRNGMYFTLRFQLLNVNYLKMDVNATQPSGENAEPAEQPAPSLPGLYAECRGRVSEILFAFLLKSNLMGQQNVLVKLFHMERNPEIAGQFVVKYLPILKLAFMACATILSPIIILIGLVAGLVQFFRTLSAEVGCDGDVRSMRFQAFLAIIF
ncbi:MAG: hypothetical protein LBB38_01495, partial [Puniceicoccales bacterium]|nr:hypothetical protein [Puniceicoccales bacterium]